MALQVQHTDEPPSTRDHIQQAHSSDSEQRVRREAGVALDQDAQEAQLAVIVVLPLERLVPEGIGRRRVRAAAVQEPREAVPAVRLRLALRQRARVEVIRVHQRARHVRADLVLVLFVLLFLVRRERNTRRARNVQAQDLLPSAIKGRGTPQARRLQHIPLRPAEQRLVELR